MPTAADVDGRYTNTLAGFVSTLRYSDLPTEVADYIKYVILDGFGCALFGGTLPWSDVLTRSVERLGGDGPVPVWGHGRSTSAERAALLNGSYLQAFELDDYSRHGGFHGCSLVLPAVMAASELREGVTGQDVITATVIGFEVGNRVGQCVGATRILSRGWHTGSVTGPMAAAAAAGSILGLDTTGMEHAFGIAGTLAGGLMAVQFGSMAKRMNHGRASQNGLLAAVLADQGYTGIKAVFEQPYGGFCSTFAGDIDAVDLEALIAGLGHDYRTFDTCLKPFACRGPINVALTALRAILHKHPASSDEVAEVRVYCTTVTGTKCGWPYQATGSATEAQMNLSYGIAVMLLEGDAFIAQYRDELLTDPRVLELIEKIQVIPDTRLDALGEKHRHHANVEVVFTDGTTLSDERQVALGSYADPLSLDDVVDKFHKLVAGRPAPERAEAVKDMVLTLDSLDDARLLGRALGEA